MEILNNNSIVEKARAFAQVLASSQEFKELYSSQEKLKKDEEAQSILNKFQEKQQEIHNAHKNSKNFSDNEIAEIEKLDHKLRTNTTIIELIVTQQNVIDLIQYTNKIISNAADFDFGQMSSGSCSC